MKILAFGEMIWDLFPMEKALGGAPLNFAAHAVYAGAKAQLLSAVGADAYGIQALEIAEGYGVDTSLVATLCEKPTGTCRITLDQNGIPSYDLVQNVAYDEIPVPSACLSETYDALAFGTLALRGASNRNAIQTVLREGHFREIFVDLNVRMPFCSTESILLGLSNATILKISDEELPLVLDFLSLPCLSIEETAREFAVRFPQIKLMLFTLGSEGSILYDAEAGSFQSIKSPKVRAVSTVGAGDSYGATFLVSYLGGATLSDCLLRATERSAYVVTQAGAVPK